jgi:hypothetical protein
VARSLSRLVLILGALVLPLWMCAAALGLAPVVHDVVSSVEAPEDRASVAPADCPENVAAAVAEIDDDNADPAEVLPPAGAPRVHPSGRGESARIGRRPVAGPPIVHLELQTPPPRA